MSNQQPNSSITHYYWLDLIRFLAALIVVLVHARGAFFVEYGLLDESNKTIVVAIFYAFTRIGHEAVIVFFVLSGYLVGGRGLERIAYETFRPTDYSIDRSVRILLPLIPALILTAIIRLLLDGSIDIAEFFGNLLSLQGIFFEPFGNNGPLWSLSYEVWFYVLLLSIGITAKKDKYFIFGLSLLSLCIFVFTVLNAIYLACWFIGALAYLIKLNKFSKLLFFTSILLSFTAITFIQANANSNSLDLNHYLEFIPNSDISKILLSLGISIFIKECVLYTPSSIITKKINLYGTIFASFSYTLYLTHYPILELIKHAGITRSVEINIISIFTYICGVCICILSSWLLYLIFEKKTKVYRNYIKSRIMR